MAYGFLAVKELPIHRPTFVKDRSDDKINAAFLQSLNINLIFLVEVLHKDRVELQRSKLSSAWHGGEANAPKHPLTTESPRELYSIIEDESQTLLGNLYVFCCLALEPYFHDFHDLGNRGCNHLLLVFCGLLRPDRCHFTQELSSVCAPVIERFVGYDLTIYIVSTSLANAGNWD